jgi:hypothetical protein
VIYRKIRYYKSNDALTRDWMNRLTKGKVDDISRLLKHEAFLKAMDMLLLFPAVLEDLELGNVRNMIALRCDENLIHHLRYIYNTWDRIMLGSPTVRHALDIRTVQSLQMRAPSASLID